MKTRSVFLILLLPIGLTVAAQNKVLLTEKPGTFKFRRDVLNGLGSDLYGKNNNFTLAEAEASQKELERLVEFFRQCPVLRENKGFDAVYDLGIGRFNSKYGYGVPSILTFYLSTWSLYKGKEVQWTIEPPQWRMETNMTDKYRDNGFNETDFSNSYNPTNPSFSEAGMRLATIEVNELFFQPGIKENIRPGIDRYGETYIIYNLDRPPYWEQVTIREVFRLLIQYWDCVPDKAQKDEIVPILKMDLAGFTEEEKDGYAYFGNPESLYRISSVRNDTPVLRPNPEYWNKNLPRSAIQVMVLEIPDKQIIKTKMEGCFEAGDGYYYIYRLLNEFSIDPLSEIIAH